MAAHLRSLTFIILLLASLISPGWSKEKEDDSEEEFHEGLLLRPLPDRKVLAHFHFQSRAPPSDYRRHHHLFPKSISQLAQKFHVKEMELSFTQGRWSYERWGGFDPVSSNNAKPPGVELWAVFDAPREEVDGLWQNLTHALSGLFCASIIFLESSTMYSAPELGFEPDSGSLRYGVLPREAVCTENLTPWLKLLPCRDKAGISALLDRPAIYRGFYHSQRLRLGSYGLGIVLEQTLTLVLQPGRQTASSGISSGNDLQPRWSLSSIFGRKVTGSCALAKSSYVHVQLEKSLVTELLKTKTYEVDIVASSRGFFSERGIELSVKPDDVVKGNDSLGGRGYSLLYEFGIGKYNDSQPFDLGFTWKVPLTWSCKQPPLHATRFLMGSGNERGAIAVLLKPKEPLDNAMKKNGADEICTLLVELFQAVPWYIKVYYHTLRLYIDGQPRAIHGFVEKIRVLPSKDKVSPGVMEVVLKLPCSMKSASLTLDFDKGFLHIDEYPPDANQGFDIPSAIVRFPDFSTTLDYPGIGKADKSPIMTKLQEKSPVLSYTEVLLVPLTTPDFSMPYNVITFTCTAYALYFGSLLNVLRRRVGEEERLLKRKAATKSGLLQLRAKLSAKKRRLTAVLLVALLAVAWQFYFK